MNREHEEQREADEAARPSAYAAHRLLTAFHRSDEEDEGGDEGAELREPSNGVGHAATGLEDGLDA